MESAFAASSFGASGSRIGTSRTLVSGPGVRKSEDKTEETGGSIYEQLYASGVRSMGDAYFVGGSAAANQAKNVLERGGSNAQALWSGLAAGAAETFFEKFSVDQLLKPKTVNNWKSLLAETAKQAGVEASEEMFTEVANILSDAAIMGDSSDFSTAVAGYTAQGMSEEKAKQMAFLDCISRVVWAGAGGALSGGVMGGTVGALNYAGGQLEGRSTANTQETLAAQDGANVQSGTVDTPTPQQAQKTASTGETVLKDYQRAEHHGNILDTVRANLGKVSKIKPVAALTGQEFQKNAGDSRNLRTKVIDFFNSIGNKVTRKDLGDIELNTSGVRDSLSHGYGKLKAATFASLPQVLEQGEILAHNAPYEGHWYDSYVISAPVRVGNETVYVGALVIKDTKQRYKLHEVLTTNESGASLFQSESTSQGADVPLRNDTPLGTPEGAPTAPIIADSSAGGNTQSAQSGPESSVGENGFRAPSAIQDADLTSAFGENGAQAYRLGWRGDMDEADYYRAFAHAYNAGAAGRSLDSLKDRTLTDAQRGAAFESGRSDADAAARKAGFTTVYGKDSGLVWDDYTKSSGRRGRLVLTPPLRLRAGPILQGQPHHGRTDRRRERDGQGPGLRH